VATTLPSWTELTRRAFTDAREDDIFGLAAQLSYYFFLALFPAILFGLGIASFFPLGTLTDDIARVLAPFVSPQVVDLIQDQMRRIGEQDSGGILTFGAAAALWSSSAALTSIIDAVNRAYDLEETRPWWKTRLLAIGLTVVTAVLILLAFSVVLAGPMLASWFGNFDSTFLSIWGVMRWPLAFALVSTAVGLIYYFGPDADQDWVWVTPGALVATVLWLVASIAFKLYVASFTDYNASYGAIGGVIVLLLWFYLSSMAVLAGAELNAEIEHAAEHAKAMPRSRDGRRLLGARARREFERCRG
jgi:membrane protein